nr:MAG TPA: hypothetical protein [Caudoviricetes sp.]
MGTLLTRQILYWEDYMAPIQTALAFMFMVKIDFLLKKECV